MKARREDSTITAMERSVTDDELFPPNVCLVGAGSAHHPLSARTISGASMNRWTIITSSRLRLQT